MHIYDEGACRPGYDCMAQCEEFVSRRLFASYKLAKKVEDPDVDVAALILENKELRAKLEHCQCDTIIDAYAELHHDYRKLVEERS